MMIKRGPFLLVIALSILINLQSVQGQIKLPAIFSSHMTFHPNSEVMLWGWADAMEKITIETSWLGKPLDTHADSSGNWRISLQTTDSNKPQIINIKGEKSSILLENVYFIEMGPASKKASNSTLVYPGEDGSLVYKPYTENGDKILDFSYCGYQRSETPIPDIPVVAQLKPPSGKATEVGTMAYLSGPDSQEKIQSALDSIASLPPNVDGFRGTLLLTKGTYYVNGSLLIRSGVVLRGEGDGPLGTTLIFKNPKGTGIYVGDSEAEIVSIGDPTKITDTYIPAASMNVSVKDPSTFRKGDHVLITKTTNDEWIKDLGMDRITEIRPNNKRVKNWKANSFQLEHVRQITDVKGNRLTLDVPLPQSIATEHGGGTIEKISIDEIDSFCGVESLRIVSNYDSSIKAVDKENKEYFSDEKSNLNCGIDLASVNGWVQNCTVKHVRLAAVRASNNARFCTVRDCKSLQPVSPIKGGRRYSFLTNGGSQILFYNCYAEKGRHDFVVGSRVSGPNAFVNCTAINSTSISEPHHRWSTGILYDNITLKKGGTLAALNRGDSGSGHGWAGANVVFWNSNAEAVVVMDPPTSEQNFAIGYSGEIHDSYPTDRLEYANARSGYLGTPNAAVYKGFVLMGSGYIEHPDRRVAPRSLFIQQLEDRIGSKRLARVMSIPGKIRIGKKPKKIETKDQAFSAKNESISQDSIMLEGKWITVRKKKFEPTLRDISYGPFERNKLDFWKAESKTPTPLVFYIHGGGWGGGSKESNNGPYLSLLKKGISYVSINYRLARNGNVLPCSLHDAARALQFVRSKAKEWNIDPDRIIASGGSAGGCSSLWLACHDDMANLNSEDPIERESTRLLAAAVISAQTTIDPWIIQQRIGNSATSHSMIWKSVGATSPKDLFENWENYKDLSVECSPLTHLSKNDPPLYLSYTSISKKPITKDGIHNAEFGNILKEAADSIGVNCKIEIKSKETRQKELEKFMFRIFNKSKIK
ncbi:alpha/beta hydrolase fold domain-containing protein [Gaetbulibacter sp. M240]|uniref:alpha/beta hydrolase fold domain-containing protein n=1 Tax=Gaetbulibacter sp. M240 TaxID=3126511 RepID=UPI00374F77D5